jgi:two-component system sensor histidine kinase ChvG
VTDIAELSRLDGELSRTRFESIDVAAMLDNVVSARELRRAPDAPAVTFDKPKRRLPVLGDEPRLVRAIENLLDNAQSFSPPGVGVSLSTARTSDEIAVFVDDGGPGIPIDRRQAIFRRFHSERPEGDFARHSGLGLAIAKTIVEAMGGRLAVEDTPSGEGTRFAIRLPVA